MNITNGVKDTIVRGKYRSKGAFQLLDILMSQARECDSLSSRYSFIVIAPYSLEARIASCLKSH